MMLRILLLTSALYAATRSQTTDSRTIFQYLQDEGYNELIELMRAAGMEAEFTNQNAAPITLFAPSDQAFENLPQSIKVELLTNMTFVNEVIRGHVTDEQILTLLIRNNNQKMDQNGNPLTFNVYGNGVKTVNGAVISGGDLILANGLVHPIDKVLLPVTESIASYVAEHDSDFRDLFGFLVLARLFGALSVPGPYTIFAPNDAAFDRVRQNMSEIVSSSDRSQLEALLKNHVVPQQLWAAGLTDGMTVSTLQGTNLTINVNGALVTINGKAHVIEPDVGATNGVIHVIDTVLFP